MADRPKTPKRDVRLAYQWLARRAPSAETRRQMRALLESWEASGSERAETDVPERPLGHPFTKGMAFLNDGVCYGELVVDVVRRGANERVHLSRRTRTGRTDLVPSLPASGEKK
ncbi:MAG: hypothetical protein DIU78_003885 [Pseudomonadota bacterium]|nr:MAG: hypothetical protein DIU78_04010 [Pseudomonadota bacterium]